MSVKIGRHSIEESELYHLIVDRIPKDQFSEIIKDIEMDLNKTKIVIIVEGGCVQEIISDNSADVLILDMDVEGTPEHDLVIYPDENNGDNSAIAKHFQVDQCPKYTEKVFKAVLPQIE